MSSIQWTIVTFPSSLYGTQPSAVGTVPGAPSHSQTQLVLAVQIPFLSGSGTGVVPGIQLFPKAAAIPQLSAEKPPFTAQPSPIPLSAGLPGVALGIGLPVSGGGVMAWQDVSEEGVQLLPDLLQDPAV